MAWSDGVSDCVGRNRLTTPIMAPIQDGMRRRGCGVVTDEAVGRVAAPEVVGQVVGKVGWWMVIVVMPPPCARPFDDASDTFLCFP